MADGLRLSTLLPERLGAIGALARRELCKNDDVGAMKLAWDYIGSQLGGAIAQALDGDLMTEIAKVWSQADALACFTDPAKHSDGERSVMEFAGHDVSQEFKPVIAVTIGSCPCVELEFNFTLSAHFGGVQLTLADGHIVEARTGEAWASAQLSYADVPLHDATETRKVTIPGSFQFEPPGVPLRMPMARLPSTGAASAS